MVLNKITFLLLTLAVMLLPLAVVVGLATIHSRDLARCPSCKLRKVRRSYLTGPVDWGLSVLGLFPFRCSGCRFRFRGLGAKEPSERNAAPQ